MKFPVHRKQSVRTVVRSLKVALLVAGVPEALSKQEKLTRDAVCLQRCSACLPFWAVRHASTVVRSLLLRRQQTTCLPSNVGMIDRLGLEEILCGRHISRRDSVVSLLPETKGSTGAG